MRPDRSKPLTGRPSSHACGGPGFVSLFVVPVDLSGCNQGRGELGSGGGTTLCSDAEDHARLVKKAEGIDIWTQVDQTSLHETCRA